MTSFSALNVGSTGLNVARANLDVVGQNIANAATEGYTRQRVSSVSQPTPAAMTLFGPTVGPGSGAAVQSFDRLADEFLNSQERSTTAAAAATLVLASSYAAIEDITGEPSDLGVSQLMQEFYASWEDVGNEPGVSAPVSVMLEKANTLADKVNSGITTLEAHWTNSVDDLRQGVAEANNVAAQLADLNALMRTTAAAGGSTNELADQRDQLTLRLSELFGGKVSYNQDGSANVAIGGIEIVHGDVARSMSINGGDTPADGAPTLTWDHQPGLSVAVGSGKLAGQITNLSPGGPVATAYNAYASFATEITAATNAVHATGVTTDGNPGGDFFKVDTTGRLQVVVTDKSQVATGAAGAGPLDGSIADKISQIGKDGVNASWKSFIGDLGAKSQAAQKNYELTQKSADLASNRQLSSASVDMDEEQLNLVQFQTQYQAAARYVNAIDELLDLVVNRLGTVGR